MRKEAIIVIVLFLPVALGLESSLEEVTSTHEGQTDEVDADVD